MIQREREKKSWSERDRSRTQSFQTDETRPDVIARQNAASKQHRAALDALFEKKPDAVEPLEKLVPAANVPRVVETVPDANRSNKRQDLLRRLTLAQGSRAISDAAEVFLRAGFELPDDQETFLQLLEHRDEERVRGAMSQLERLLAGQLAKRKPVLLQRLKRLEENADEAETRAMAAQLRRTVA